MQLVAHKSPIPEGATLINEMAGSCQDGSGIILRLYDVNPLDPTAPVYMAWYRGNVLIAVRKDQDESIYVAVLEREVPLAELVQKYPTPCDLPFSGGSQ